MTGADSLLQTAADRGVAVCFANPGTTEMPLVIALDRAPRIRSILGLFEGVCTGAADGYGRMTGRPALTLLHLGPGFANGIANLHNARRARSPVVNLIGDHASWHLEHDAPLTSDIASLATPVSGWLRSADSSKRLAEEGAAAIAAALGPPGQVATLIVPADVQWGEGAAPAAPAASRPVLPRPDRDRIDAVAARLRKSERPLLLLGGPALGGAAQKAADRVARACGARLLVETFPARWERGAGLPPIERLPYFPEQALDTLGQTDLVVPVGAPDPVSFFGYEGQPSRFVEVERLARLCTAEEDAGAALEALAEALHAPAEALAEAAPLPPAPSGALNSASIGAALARSLPEGAIVVDESATSGLPFYAASMGSPRHTLLALTGGAIGQGLPVATGAAVACPDRKVIAFQADGSAQYTLQSLWTQAREGLDVTTLLCSNRAYRILQVELARAGVKAPGPTARALTDLGSPALDWVSLARGYGVPAQRVESAEDLVRALPRALEEPGPQLLELVI